MPVCICSRAFIKSDWARVRPHLAFAAVFAMAASPETSAGRHESCVKGLSRDSEVSLTDMDRGRSVSMSSGATASIASGGFDLLFQRDDCEVRMVSTGRISTENTTSQRTLPAKYIAAGHQIAFEKWRRAGMHRVHILGLVTAGSDACPCHAAMDEQLDLALRGAFGAAKNVIHPEGEVARHQRLQRFHQCC